MEQIPPGALVNRRYRVTGVLSAGAQSFVYSADDITPVNSWERAVVLKQYTDLPATTAALEHTTRHFQTLRTSLAAKRHYFVLPLTEFISHTSVIAVFQKIKGKSLEEYLSDGIEDALALRFAHATTKAVAAMHASSVAHLDLKPGNIIIQRNVKGEFVQIIDFDAARLGTSAMREEVMGTYGYMSPEHISRGVYGEVSIASDMFSLGAMLYELLFGVRAFAFSDADTYFRAVASGPPPIPAAQPYSADLAECVHQCLQPQPGRRPTASRLAVQLARSHGHTVARPEPEIEAVVPSSTLRSVTLVSQDQQFKRVYYSAQTITSTELRGSGVKLGSVGRPVMTLVPAPTGWHAILRDDTTPAQIGDTPMMRDSPYALPNGCWIYLGGVWMWLTHE